ncbi:MAG: hypothetical protein HC923_11200 [Myxococcales bacterium]|nr:hypothetical protein [Myxococcales bacterium]
MLQHPTDLGATNGVIHAIDRVILPPALLDILADTSSVSLFHQTVGESSASLQGSLSPDVFSGDEPLTLFVPTNDSFSRLGLPGSSPDERIGAQVVRGRWTLTELRDAGAGASLATLSGQIFRVEAVDGEVTLVTSAGERLRPLLEQSDIRARNGVLHVVDDR